MTPEDHQVWQDDPNQSGIRAKDKNGEWIEYRDWVNEQHRKEYIKRVLMALAIIGVVSALAVWAALN